MVNEVGTLVIYTAEHGHGDPFVAYADTPFSFGKTDLEHIRETSRVGSRDKILFILPAPAESGEFIYGSRSLHAQYKAGPRAYQVRVERKEIKTFKDVEVLY